MGRSLPRFAVTLFSLAAALAAPLTAAACMASLECPLQLPTESCHRSAASTDSPDPTPSAPSDTSDCCDALDAPAAKEKGLEIRLLPPSATLATGAAGAVSALPAWRGRPLATDGGHVRGAPSLALLCTLLI